MRDALRASGKPYVIENVPGSPLLDPVILCGTQFNLTTHVEGRKAGLYRHRLFETSFPVPDAGEHDHSYPPVIVAGHGQPAYTKAHGYLPARLKHWHDVMEITWMTRSGLARAVPPAYTCHVGKAAKAHIKTRGKLALAA